MTQKSVPPLPRRASLVAGVTAWLRERLEQGEWVGHLYRSTEVMQRWFAKKARKVVAGSCHEGVNLIQVDTDFRAASRHAASRMVALGHRHLAVLAPVVALAGDEESLAGFEEGQGDAQVEVLRCRDATESVTSAVRKMLSGTPCPTAVFVLKAGHAATALTYLLQQGVPVPGRMSLVSRDHEPFFQNLCPELTCYRRQSEVFAKKLASLISALEAGPPPQNPRHLLMPTFHRGETLARKPVSSKNNQFAGRRGMRPAF